MQRVAPQGSAAVFVDAEVSVACVFDRKTTTMSACLCESNKITRDEEMRL